MIALAALLLQVAPMACGCPVYYIDFPAVYCQSEPGITVTWGGDPDLTLDLYVIERTVIVWEGRIVELPEGEQSVRPAAIWPEYLDYNYRAEWDRGERVVTVMVCGRWWGHARRDAPGGGIVYPTSITWSGE